MLRSHKFYCPIEREKKNDDYNHILPIVCILMKNLVSGAIGQCVRFWWPRRIQFLPSFNPCDHGICKLVEIVINLAKFSLDLLGEFKVAFLRSCAFLWKRNRLEKWDELFLPVQSFVLLLKVYKRVAGFAVPDVRQTCLHPQSQMITYHLHHQPINLTISPLTYFHTSLEYNTFMHQPAHMSSQRPIG